MIWTLTAKIMYVCQIIIYDVLGILNQGIIDSRHKGEERAYNTA